jgi:Flp pilus assembly secretin CpaC
LGSPTLQMIDGTLATFRAGDQQPVAAPGSANEGLPNSQHLGLEVELLPKVEAAGTISAAFHCRYTEPLPGNSGRTKGASVPTLNKREVAIRCELKPGQTLVMHGPVQVSESVRTRGLIRGRGAQAKPEERKLIVLLRLELAAASAAR